MKFVLLQNFIDKIRKKPNTTKLITYKWLSYKNTKNVETLILGSSHLANGYYAQNGEFNFALPSQDLYYSYNLYKKINRSTIKNIVVAFSVFTPGLSIVKTKCSDLCIPYKLLFDIEYQDDAFIQEKKNLYLEKEIEKEIKTYIKAYKEGDAEYGNLLRYPSPKFNAPKAVTRSLKHLKNNQREKDQMVFCKNIIDEAASNGQNVIFVLPPTTKAYRASLPATDLMFEKLYKLCNNKQHVMIINLFDTKIFDKKDFTNEDHLNKKGAIKCSSYIRSRIIHHFYTNQEVGQ